MALEMNMRRSVYMGLVLRNDLVCEVTEMMVHGYTDIMALIRTELPSYDLSWELKRGSCKDPIFKTMSPNMSLQMRTS